MIRKCVNTATTYLQGMDQTSAVMEIPSIASLQAADIAKAMANVARSLLSSLDRGVLKPPDARRKVLHHEGEEQNAPQERRLRSQQASYRRPGDSGRAGDQLRSTRRRRNSECSSVGERTVQRDEPSFSGAALPPSVRESERGVQSAASRLIDLMSRRLRIFTAKV